LVLEEEIYMSIKERIFHTLLFEFVALVILATGAYWLTGEDPVHLTGLAISLSLLAMIWNYVFNLGFDRMYGEDRLSRGLKLRTLHGFLFEIGMLIFSFPVIMWVLELSFWNVLIMDISVVVFFLIYAISFNWVYDKVRAMMFSGTAIIE
jgi:uncharacterized membrane protein